MDCSMPGFLILHYLPEFPQTHLHWVDDAIHLSHFLSSSSPPAPQPFTSSEFLPVSHFLASGGQIIGASASIFPMNSQSWFPLGLSGLISLLSKGLSMTPRTIVHQASMSLGILQKRILEWVATSFSRGSFQPRDWTGVFRSTGWFLTCLSHQGSLFPY